MTHCVLDGVPGGKIWGLKIMVFVHGGVYIATHSSFLLLINAFIQRIVTYISEMISYSVLFRADRRSDSVLGRFRVLEESRSEDDSDVQAVLRAAVPAGPLRLRHESPQVCAGDGRVAETTKS